MFGARSIVGRAPFTVATTVGGSLGSMRTSIAALSVMAGYLVFATSFAGVFTR